MHQVNIDMVGDRDRDQRANGGEAEIRGRRGRGTEEGIRREGSLVVVVVIVVEVVVGELRTSGRGPARRERGEGGRRKRKREKEREIGREHDGPGTFTAARILGPPTLHFHLEELRLNDLEGGTAEEIKGEERRGGN